MKIFANGTLEIALAANDKIAIFSNSSIKLYQEVGYPNFPSSWNLLETTDDGETYTSAAFSAAATVRIDAGPSDVFYEVGTAPVIGEPLADQSFADATGIIQGLAAAQGGSSTLKGGTSSTAGNAGGAALLTGGTPGATGVGGAATVAAGAGGATSGNGGVASLTGGAGTNGNSTGGIGKTVGGAGQGTGAGGAAQLTGGASGAGATGNGGNSSVTGGAAASTNGNGGSVVLTAGAKAGTGVDGVVYARHALSRKITVTAMTTTATVTVAAIIGGQITANQGAAGAATYTLPTGTVLAAALPSDFGVGDSLEFSITNISTNAAEDVTVAGDTGMTAKGSLIVAANSGVTELSFATFRIVNTGANTFDFYRI